MGPRVLQLNRGFSLALGRLGIVGTSRERARIGKTLRELCEAPELPTEQDYAVMMPPVLEAWARRIPRTNLWLFYRFTDDQVTVITISRSPPVPVET